MVQEEYFLEIKSFDPDQEPEEKHIYSFNVSDFEIYSDHIVFKNCINSKILSEFYDLNLFEKPKKMTGYFLLLNLKLSDDKRVVSDSLWFPYEFNYTDTDFIIHYFIVAENTEWYEPSLQERMDIFLKNKQFFKLYLENNATKKQWFNLNEFEKLCWLDVAFQVNQQANEHMPKVSHIILDGNFIHSEDDLYCYIGEEAVGIFGYMGWNVAALRDCLEDEGLRPIHRPLSITWHNFNNSKQNFDSIEDLNYLVEFLNEHSNFNIEF